MESGNEHPRGPRPDDPAGPGYSWQSPPQSFGIAQGQGYGGQGYGGQGYGGQGYGGQGYGPSPFGAPPGEYGAPAYGSGPPPGHGPAAGAARGRPGLIVLMSFVVQLVIVAAVGNQGVSRHLSDYGLRHQTLFGAFVRTPTVYAWRFTPLNGDNQRLFQAQFALLAALFVFSALLSLAVVRGPITFGRALFGVWMSVIVATFLGGIADRAVVKNFGQYSGYGGRPAGIVFGSSGFELVAGVLLGFLAGLVAGLVAVVSRRPAPAAAVYAPPPEPQPEPEAPPPFYGNERRESPDDATRTLSMQKVQQSVGEPVPVGTTDDTGAHGTRRLPDTEAFRPPATEQREPAAPPATSSAPSPAGRPASPEPSSPEPSSPEPPSAEPSPPADATTRLPRYTGEPPASESSASESSASESSASESSAQWPPQASNPPPGERRPEQGGDHPTTQFPRPPDEGDLGDLGQQPD